MYDKNNFGKRLANLRKLRWSQYKKNLGKYPNPYEKFSCCKSQETLATAINVERRTLGKWELGTVSPTIDKVVELCDMLECNVDYLLGAEELIGLSPSVIASHYSKIPIEIINYGLRDNNYLDFLKHFMHPNNCSELINDMTLTAWKDFLSKSTLDEIYEPLKSLIEDVFQKYEAFAPINDYSKESYRKYILSALPKEKITFSNSKLDNQINIKTCIDKSLFESLALSNEDELSYERFIDYIVDYSFNILTNKEKLNLHKERLGKTFVQIFEDFLSK